MTIELFICTHRITYQILCREDPKVTSNCPRLDYFQALSLVGPPNSASKVARTGRELASLLALWKILHALGMPWNQFLL